MSRPKIEDVENTIIGVVFIITTAVLAWVWTDEERWLITAIVLGGAVVISFICIMTYYVMRPRENHGQDSEDSA